MKIFFTASYYGKNQYQKYYDLVLDSLERQKVDVISPEKGNYLSLLTPHELIKYPTREEQHYWAIKKGITLADAVVIESSYPDFQVGFETAYAVESKKYVLVLATNKNFGEVIDHPFFIGHQYSEFTIDWIIERFLTQVSHNQFPERFNFFLSPTQLSFLEDESKRAGLNKSELLRNLINRELANKTLT